MTTAAALPRGGRHALTQQAVADSQRHRMLLAVMQAVGEKGYAATTVADVIALAGVSRRTFYEHFPKIEDCFLAAYDWGVESLFAAMRARLQDAPRGDWRQRTRASIDAYMQSLAEAPPGAAWAYSIEVMGAGRQALAKRATVLAQWAQQWRSLLAVRDREEPGRDTPTDACLFALVGGIEELVRECLRAHGPRHLPAIAGDAAELALSVLNGR